MATSIEINPDKKLHCEGHACEKCGHCRDWYWRPDGEKKVYVKHSDARCFYNYGGYPYHDGSGYDHYFFDDLGYTYSIEDRRRYFGSGPLCACEDNRF